MKHKAFVLFSILISLCFSLQTCGGIVGEALNRSAAPNWLVLSFLLSLCFVCLTPAISMKLPQRIGYIATGLIVTAPFLTLNGKIKYDEATNKKAFLDREAWQRAMEKRAESFQIKILDTSTVQGADGRELLVFHYAFNSPFERLESRLEKEIKYISAPHCYARKNDGSVIASINAGGQSSIETIKHSIVKPGNFEVELPRRDGLGYTSRRFRITRGIWYEAEVIATLSSCSSPDKFKNAKNIEPLFSPTAISAQEIITVVKFELFDSGEKYITKEFKLPLIGTFDLHHIFKSNQCVPRYWCGPESLHVSAEIPDRSTMP